MRKVILAALAVTAMTPAAAFAQDRHDIQRDRMELQRDRMQDQHNLQRERTELQRDRMQDRHDLQRERTELQRDRMQTQHDRLETRRDIIRDNAEHRADARADWRAYREANRNLYRMRPWVGPRGYAYRPVNIGFRFAPMFYTQRYWMADPWTYRLPAARPGLRWIRYGNDAILIRTRTGIVVEVLRDFFW